MDESQSFRFPCLKCKKPYESPETEQDYCPTCKAEVKSIAAQIDARFDTTRPQPMSQLQQFEATAHKFQGPNGRTIYFGKA